ncbi:MAG: hypothetical protein ACJ741_05320 [Pyrinomonadaceae bacterium]
MIPYGVCCALLARRGLIQALGRQNFDRQMSQSEVPNPYQVLAWIAASVGAGIALIQLLFNSIRERRVRRQDQARFGYELLDTLFDDPAGEVLRKIDRGKWSTDKTTDDAKFFKAFRQAFESGRSSNDQDVIAARLEFDRALYYFDRIQHAIEANLTRLEDVRAPLRWYAEILQESETGIAAYAEGVYYERAVRLLAELTKPPKLRSRLSRTH